MRQEYMEPRPPHVANAGTLDDLRRQVLRAERAVQEPDLDQATRLERRQTWRQARHALAQAELRARQETEAQPPAHNAARPSRNLCLNGPGRPVTLFEAAGSPSQPGDEITWDDSGTMALNASSFARASGKVAANAGRAPEFMEPKPYWK